MTFSCNLGLLCSPLAMADSLAVSDFFVVCRRWQVVGGGSRHPDVIVTAIGDGCRYEKFKSWVSHNIKQFWRKLKLINTY
jgi:hypothetical protein